MRFSTPTDVLNWANKVAAEDIQRHKDSGVDLNPYCTEGARNDWQRGYDNLGPRSWEGSRDFDTMYQRGRAAARLLAEEVPE